MMEFKHISVLLNETVEALNIKPNGIYVDGTAGGAGHSREIAKKLKDVLTAEEISEITGLTINSILNM